MELQDVRSRAIVSKRPSNNPDARAEHDTVPAARKRALDWTQLSIDLGDADEEIDQCSKSLFEAVTSSEGNRVKNVQEILERGVDLNKRHGGKKRTLLHQLLRRYRPDSPVNDDEVVEDLAIVQLFLFFGCDVDVKDWLGNSCVHQAIVSNVPTDLCRALFAKSTEDVFADEEFKRLYLNYAVRNTTPESFRRNLVERRVWSWPPDDRMLCMVLGHVIATRPDWPVFVQSAIEETPQDFARNIDHVLAFAATYGTAESVKFLLENGANPNADVKCPVLLEAAVSTREAKAKIKLLLARGAVPLTGSFSYCDPASSLCGAPSRRSAHDARLIAMIMAGSNKVDSELFDMDFYYLQPMAVEGSKLVEESSRPLQMALRLSRLYRKLAITDDTNRQECRTLADKFEAFAVDMLEYASPTDARTALEEDMVAEGVRNQQKKFLSHSKVQRAVRVAWYASEQGLCWKQFFRSLLFFLLHVVVYSLFSPVVWISTPLHRNKLSASGDTPIGKLARLVFSFPTSSMAVVNYVVHAFSLVLLVLVLVLTIHHGSSVVHFKPVEWILLVFLIGMIEEEISQVKRHKLKRYLTLQSIEKWTDVLVAVLLILYFLLRFIVVETPDVSLRSHVQRAAIHVLGFVTLTACIRIIAFLQAHSTLGPIQISFLRVTANVINFLVILAMFLFGFSTCVAAIYSSYSYAIPESLTSGNVNGTGTASQAMIGQVPSAVDGIFESLQSLFWGLFGIIELSEFEIVGAESTPAETVVGVVMLAIWMVSAVIVMLNLLIALISSSFEGVQENAEIEWKFARAKIVFAGFVQAIPVPLNILSIPRRYCCAPKQSTKRQVCYDINYLAKTSLANGQLVEQLRRHWRDAEAQKTATKADVQLIISDLDKVSAEKDAERESHPIVGESANEALLLKLQEIREDYRHMQDRLFDRLSGFEKKLTEMDAKLSALQTAHTD